MAERPDDGRADADISPAAEAEAGPEVPARQRGERLISISEIFGPVLQGEGPVLGEPTVFVRTGGCDWRCSFCDSLHAVLPQHKNEWAAMTAGEIWVHIRRLAPNPIMITLSGGNPAMQPLEQLIRLGHATGYTFCIETQGSIAPDWLSEVDIVVLSPKPPSAGMAVRWDRFQRCLEVAASGTKDGHAVVIKIPVFDDTDLDWVERKIDDGYLGTWPLYLSVGNPFPPGDPAAAPDMNLLWNRGEYEQPPLAVALLERYQWLAAEVLRRGIPCRVTPQMHTLVHGNRRGV